VEISRFSLLPLLAPYSIKIARNSDLQGFPVLALRWIVVSCRWHVAGMSLVLVARSFSSLPSRVIGCLLSPLMATLMATLIAPLVWRTFGLGIYDLQHLAVQTPGGPDLPWRPCSAPLYSLQSWHFHFAALSLSRPGFGCDSPL
jgi:hypothetical protein